MKWKRMKESVQCGVNKQNDDNTNRKYCKCSTIHRRNDGWEKKKNSKPSLLIPKKNTATEMVICLEWGRWGCFYMLATAKTVAVNAIRFGRPKWTTIIFFPAILKSWLLCTYTFIVEKKLEQHQMCLDKKRISERKSCELRARFSLFFLKPQKCAI